VVPLSFLIFTEAGLEAKVPQQRAERPAGAHVETVGPFCMVAA